MNKADKIEKNEYSVSLTRGPGYGISAWDTELPDEGARITFRGSYDGGLHIDFGYRTPAWKDHSRSINLNSTQSLNLILFLQELIVNTAMKTTPPKPG